MGHVIAQILLGIKPLVFDFPSQASGAYQFCDGLGLHREIADEHKMVAGTGAVRVMPRLITLEPLELMRAIGERGHPPIESVLPGCALLHPLFTRLRFPGALTRQDGVPHGWQVAVFEGHDEPPVRVAADVEKGFVGIQACTLNLPFNKKLAKSYCLSY